MVRFVGLLLFTAASFVTSPAQNQPNTTSKPDVATLLREVSTKYENSKFYNIEAVEETEFNGDLSRQWNKAFINAAVAPGNRYRFEGRTDFGWIVKISDGQTEWVFKPSAKMYTEKPAPDPGPSQYKGPESMSFYQGQGLARSLSGDLSDLLNPVYLEDETLTLNGRQVQCYVVSGAGRYHGGWASDTISQRTIWIDKDTRVVRKVHSHLEGALMHDPNPYRHLIQNQTTVYPVADLESPSLPDPDFKFQPPPAAKLVDEFPDFIKSYNRDLVGKAAPGVKFQAADGKKTALSEFRGKPVLLDFWATWCAPCVASLSPLEKLFHEASGKGLLLISIDEDKDAKTATEFREKHGELWPDFHDSDGSIRREFFPGGIPEFVLIDPSGKITYADHAFDEYALRAAIAKLGPEFAPIAAKPKP